MRSDEELQKVFSDDKNFLELLDKYIYIMADGCRVDFLIQMKELSEQTIDHSISDYVSRLEAEKLKSVSVILPVR